MTKQKGIKCKVAVVDDLDANQVLAGQRDATLNRSAETIDATSKDSDGWKENEIGLKEWSVDAGGLLIESDVSYGILEEKFMNDEKVTVVVTLASGTEYKGQAIITDFPVELPYEDLVTYTVSFTGDGVLVKTPAV